MRASKLIIISSDNGLSPGRRQAIIWPNDGLVLNGPLGKKLQLNFYINANICIQEIAFENVTCQMVAICLEPNVLTHWDLDKMAAGDLPFWAFSVVLSLAQSPPPCSWSPPPAAVPYKVG